MIERIFKPGRFWPTLVHDLNTVRGRLIVLLGIVLLSALLLTGIGVLTFIYRTETLAWRGRQSEAARNAALRVAAFIQRANDALDLVARLEQESLVVEQAVIQQLVAQNPAVQEILYVDARGQILASASQQQALLANQFTISQSQWFLTAKQGDRYYGPIQLSPAGESYLIMARPGTRETIIAARLQMNILSDVVAEIQFGERGRAFVLNPTGRIIAHTNPQNVQTYTEIDHASPLFTALTLDIDEWFGSYRDVDGMPVVGVTSAVPGTEWVIVTELPQSEAFATSRLAFFLLCLSTVVLGLLILLLSARSLEAVLLIPLEELRRGAERIRDGDLAQRIVLPRPDEIGQVALAFNQMAAELQEVYTSLEQKIAERTHDLEQQRAELERSNTELAQFAYIASHDLQEPLRMVTSYLQLLERRYSAQLDETAHEFIGFAVDGANRMQQLIRDLLLYSRVGTQSKPFVRTPCEQILQGVLNNLQVAIEETQAVITHDDLPEIAVDATQFGQLLQNLIGNALKFRGQEPPVIHIGAEQQGATWLFSVQDNGIGIEPQYNERIFVIFQQLHTRDKYPGTGIGLAICRKIVERHGGRIWVESVYGEGTTFYFTVPMHDGRGA
jgi:signal transduction histidine kinase